MLELERLCFVFFHQSGLCCFIWFVCLIVLIAVIFAKRLEWAARLKEEDADEEHNNKITLGQLQKPVLLLTSSEETLNVIKQQHLSVPSPSIGGEKGQLQSKHLADSVTHNNNNGIWAAVSLGKLGPHFLSPLPFFCRYPLPHLLRLGQEGSALLWMDPDHHWCSRPSAYGVVWVSVALLALRAGCWGRFLGVISMAVLGSYGSCCSRLGCLI